jgi:beta-glucosidase
MAGELGAELVKGLQGFPADLANENKIAACMKHFIGYGDSKTGHDRTPSWISDRFLREYFIPPFQASVDAGIATGMESYGDINGDAVAASKKYLKDILRDDMKFEGMLVTDWNEIDNLHTWHKVAGGNNRTLLIA